jgi:hypothetical protein
MSFPDQSVLQTLHKWLQWLGVPDITQGTAVTRCSRHYPSDCSDWVFQTLHKWLRVPDITRVTAVTGCSRHYTSDCSDSVFQTLHKSLQWLGYSGTESLYCCIENVLHSVILCIVSCHIVQSFGAYSLGTLEFCCAKDLNKLCKCLVHTTQINSSSVIYRIWTDCNCIMHTACTHCSSVVLGYVESVIVYCTQPGPVLALWCTESGETLKFLRFEVFTAVTMKNGVFWDVTPCGFCKNRRFGGT